IYAHQCSIPFENLDVYDFRKEISLTEEALYDKFIVQRRGGYCFEMNGFFCGMLRSMGFDARPCLCRVMFGLTDPSQNLFDHRATIVTLDGKDYFCEVGLGGAMPPASMEIPAQGLWRADPEDVWHEMKGEEFSIRAIEPGWYGTMRRVRLERDIYEDPFNRKERLEVMFTTIAVHEIDFTSLNYYLSHAAESLFHRQRIVNLRTERGYRALTGLVYREVADGIRREQTLIPEELPVILKENFGVELTTEQIRYFAG
uniref:arylamine N-acetyltransferase family protein n=1 Tax=uncultured Eubacterium sp. TaxID=165185 RepID=UPI0025F33AA4